MKSSGSRQNSETRAEPFPKPQPQPIFPRRVRLHVPHTYNRWNAHHISGPCSYSAACAFQLCWEYCLTHQSRRLHHIHFFSCSIFQNINRLWDIMKCLSSQLKCLSHLTHCSLMTVVFLLNSKSRINHIGKCSYFQRLNKRRSNFLDSNFSGIRIFHSSYRDII